MLRIYLWYSIYFIAMITSLMIREQCIYAADYFRLMFYTLIGAVAVYLITRR